MEERLVWANCWLRRLDYRLINYQVLGRRIGFRVWVRLMSDEIAIEVKSATVYTNAREVIEEICHRLGIETTLDLALVFAQDETEIILDDDQILYNYVKLVDEAEELQRKIESASSSSRFSLFDRFSWSSEMDGKKVKKMALCLRKIISLSHAIE